MSYFKHSWTISRVGSFSFKYLLNFAYATMKFHNCLYVPHIIVVTVVEFHRVLWNSIGFCYVVSPQNWHWKLKVSIPLWYCPKLSYEVAKNLLKGFIDTKHYWILSESLLKSTTVPMLPYILPSISCLFPNFIKRSFPFVNSKVIRKNKNIFLIIFCYLECSEKSFFHHFLEFLRILVVFSYFSF